MKKIRRRNIFGICQIRINNKYIRNKIEIFISAVRKDIDLESEAGRGAYRKPVTRVQIPAAAYMFNHFSYVLVIL